MKTEDFEEFDRRARPRPELTTVFRTVEIHFYASFLGKSLRFTSAVAAH
jgi:hypothetical protein